MNKDNLNLARKWRSKNFEQIVGQDLVVRMLKNGLFLNKFFPVYLFSGQRGCGKTSTARIFSTAINCEKLQEFQKKPKEVALPCFECGSCRAMQENRHPDFIEIDAASNTGVDNIRQIIDSSSFLPLLGRKKVYLIDEAHMLSKAAFNAFLKILEEPPTSVFFILATTDMEKIIETVRSRCFQLFFNPVSINVLSEHLKNICIEEKINFEEEALLLLARESEGSVRDAINLLEQVYFSSEKIDTNSGLKVLGHISDETIIKLLNIVLRGSPKNLLDFLQEIKFEDFYAENVWKKLIILLRSAVWVKCDLQPRFFNQFSDELKKILMDQPLVKISSILELFYANEITFIKITDKHALLEAIMLQICQKNDKPKNLEEIKENKIEIEKASSKNEKWDEFVQTVEKLDDSLLNSIFRQAIFLSYENNFINIEIPRQLGFLKDLLENSKNSWQPILRKIFSESVELKTFFSENKVVENNFKEQKSVNVEKKVSNNNMDISDKDKWKKANILVEQFSGNIQQVEDLDE